MDSASRKFAADINPGIRQRTFNRRKNNVIYRSNDRGPKHAYSPTQS